MSTLNRHAYEQLIAEDIAALRRHMPDSLERRHIEDVLRDSIRVHYMSNGIPASEDPPSLR